MAITCCMAAGSSTSFISKRSTTMPQRVLARGDALVQQVVDLVALLQHLVQVVLADDVAQARQRELVDRRGGVADGDHRRAAGR